MAAGAALTLARRHLRLHQVARWTPKDRTARRIAAGVRYGPLPCHRLDVYAPRRPAAGPLPILLFFYGGGWSSGERDYYGFVGRALAARGFITVIPDYRLVPQVRFPAFLEDCAEAVRWARAEGGAHGGDPDRLLLAGHSAGAYNAAMLALDPQWLAGDRGAVRGFVGLAGPYDFLPLAPGFATEALGRWPVPEETQPAHFAAPGAPPALLISGDRDDVVSPQNSLSLAARLHATGNAADLRVLPGIGHVELIATLAQPLRWRAPVLAAIAGFAARVTATAVEEAAFP
ncbi:alpha/beta hydrolase [Flavisphingomonas formosensis]|uniref:alpha/beta hydrolase n=1 Tax=Flavisphingomonas formosensis TaxID=861534 RepID=UPI001E5DB472|nr:alpha/beta hydrolase [Sphingomonas formosensis]